MWLDTINKMPKQSIISFSLFILRLHHGMGNLIYFLSKRSSIVGKRFQHIHDANANGAANFFRENKKISWMKEKNTAIIWFSRVWKIKKK